jgi:uncharacterized tellurite resistance protein B-like protein
MFDALFNLFKQTESYETPLPEADARHAVGALLVRAAKADRAYLFEEVEQIDRVLAERNNLTVVEAAKMRASCEKLEEAMPNTAQLAEILRNAISAAEKEATVRALWTVVLADGVEHEDEDELMHQVENILGLSPGLAKRLHDEAVARSKSFQG